MSKKVKIIIAVMAVLAIGGAVYYFMVYKPKKVTALDDANTALKTAPETTTAIVTSLASTPAPEVAPAEVANLSLIKTIRPVANEPIVLV